MGCVSQRLVRWRGSCCVSYQIKNGGIAHAYIYIYKYGRMNVCGGVQNGRSPPISGRHREIRSTDLQQCASFDRPGAACAQASFCVANFSHASIAVTSFRSTDLERRARRCSSASPTCCGALSPPHLERVLTIVTPPAAMFSPRSGAVPSEKPGKEHTQTHTTHTRTTHTHTHRELRTGQTSDVGAVPRP